LVDYKEIKASNSQSKIKASKTYIILNHRDSSMNKCSFINADVF